MKRTVMKIVGALALLHGAPVLGNERMTTEPVDLGTKPIVRALRAGQAPRTPTAVSQDEFARWDAAQSKPVVRLLRAERERRARSAQSAPEPSTAVAQCWGMKPVQWTLNRCGEESTEVGAASNRP